MIILSPFAVIAGVISLGLILVFFGFMSMLAGELIDEIERIRQERKSKDNE